MAKSNAHSDEIKSWKDFERELERLGEDIRQHIELECEAFAPDKEASKARVARVQHDYKFFCQTYFPHYVPTPHFSQFQEFIFKRLPECIDSPQDAREVHLAPRGEAKSTYETQLGSLWCIVTNRKHMIGIIMNTEEQASEMLESIKAELDTNPRLMMDFPHATGQGRVWQATTIVTANNIKVRIGGTGKKIRGMKHGAYRPDLIFLDDLENDEQVRQKAQRDKTEKYVKSAVLGLAPPGGGMDVFWVGTALHYNAAIMRMANAPGWRKKLFKAIMAMPSRMDLWDKWESIYTRIPVSAGDREAAELAALGFYQAHQEEMTEGAAVSWPNVRDLYRLMCIRATDHDAFNQEYQNEAGNDEDAPFKNIHFWTDRCANWLYFGAIDPSLGKRGGKGDPSAILVGALNRDKMILDVVEADIARRVPDLIIDRAIDLQAEYRCMAWAIETVQFQAFFYSELLKRATMRRMAFPGVAVTPLTDKDLRIISLQPHVNNGHIRLHRSQSTLIEQLRFYPEADHDDGPDALEMLWTIAKDFGGEWRYTSAGTTRHSAFAQNTSEDWNDPDNW